MRDLRGAASYQQVTSKLVRGGSMEGDKSGIWRFYRRVWKNIFYERRDKERERGVLGMRGRSYIFLKSFEGGGGEFEILWGNVFLGYV